MVKTFSVYSWGANSYGQLGLGHLNDTLKPEKCCELDAIPTNITAGGGHAVILECQKKMLTCGLNDKGQLGLGTFANECQWKLVELPDDFVDVTCGWDFTIALSSRGKIYGTGSNLHGQLLQLKSVKNSNVFLELEALNQPGKVYKNISAGLRHAAAIDLDGVVYCWGSNNHGQLGQSTKKWHDEPVRVVLPYAANSVTCGENFTAALLSTGEVWFWGNGKYLNSKGKFVLPQKLFDTILPNGVLSSGWNHLVVHQERQLYAVGRHDYGQLGSKTAINSEVNEIDLKDVSTFCCGSQYNLAIVDGKLVTWGWNEHGSCGNNSESDVCIPVFIKDTQNCLRIGAGAGCSFYVC